MFVGYHAVWSFVCVRGLVSILLTKAQSEGALYFDFHGILALDIRDDHSRLNNWHNTD